MSLDKQANLNSAYIAKNIAHCLEVKAPRLNLLDRIASSIFYLRTKIDPLLAGAIKAAAEYNEYFQGDFESLVQRDLKDKKGRRDYLRKNYGLETKEEQDAFEVVHWAVLDFSFSFHDQEIQTEKELQRSVRTSNDLLIVERGGKAYIKKIDWDSEEDRGWFEQIKKSGAQYNPIQKIGPLKINQTWLKENISSAVDYGIEALKDSYISPQIQKKAKVNPDFKGNALRWILTEIDSRLDANKDFWLFEKYHLSQKKGVLYIQKESKLESWAAGPPREKSKFYPSIEAMLEDLE
jgi:hypothetical protein